MAQQTQAARDAYEEALGAPDRASQIEALSKFIDQYCTADDQSYECSQARRRYDLLTGAYFRDLMSRCDTANMIVNKIICLQDAQKEYPTGAMGQIVMKALFDAEEEYWNTLDRDPSSWLLDGFEEYTRLLPNGNYFDEAQDKIEFLSAAGSLDPEVFYTRYVTGRGDDKLAYFQDLYPDHTLAQQAALEANRTEETLWADVISKDNIQAYERYLRWYPQGRFSEEALTRIRDESTPAAPAFTKDQMSWQVVQHTADPEVIRAFIEDYPQSDLIEEADKLLIALDDQYWSDAQNHNSLAAYERYLQVFPDGAFVNEARSRLTTSNNEGEDIYWASIMESPNIENLQTYLSLYPRGKYRIQVRRLLQKLKDAEYRIENKNGVFVIQFFNATNLSIIQASDTLFINDKRLQSKNILEVSIKESGRYSIVLEDENGKRIVVDLSRIIYVEDYVIAADSVMVYVGGGSEPYSVNFQDTAIGAQLRVFELEEEFNEGLIAMAKSRLLDLCGRGTFQVILKDRRREQTEIAGMIHLQPSRRKVILYVTLILGALIGIGITWSRIYGRLNRRKSVFDEMDYEEEWDELN